MHKEQIKILAADDDPDILEILDIVLKREGYQVVLAKNGEEAVRFASPDIDLFILDIAMPGLRRPTRLRLPAAVIHRQAF